MKKNILIVIASFAIVGIIYFLNNDQAYNSKPAITKETEQLMEAETPKESNSQVAISATCVNLLDDYVNDDCLSKLYGEENVISRLQDFNQELNINANYYEASFQPLQCLDYYNLSDDFVLIYNRKGGKIHNQIVEIDGVKCYVTSLNTIQVNKNFNDKFLSVGGGDVFINDDFILDNLDIIPVILGNNYRNYFSIGDTMQLDYLGTMFTFYIKGFLAPDAKLKIDDETFNLDNYICVPNFQYVTTNQVSEDSEHFTFLARYYLQNNSGYFQCETPDDVDTIDKKVKELANEYKLNYSLIDNIFTFELTE